MEEDIIATLTQTPKAHSLVQEHDQQDGVRQGKSSQSHSRVFQCCPISEQSGLTTPMLWASLETVQTQVLLDTGSVF